MKLSSSHPTQSQGLILVVVIGLLAILAVLATFYLKQSNAHKKVSHQRVLHAQAKLIAQSGIEAAVAKLRNLYLKSKNFPTHQCYHYYGGPAFGTENGVAIHEFGVATIDRLDDAAWPSMAVTDEITGLPLSLDFHEDGKDKSLGWSGSFDGTFIDDGDFYSLRVVDAQAKLNINDQNPQMGRLINRLCEVLYYDEDFNRNGVLDNGEDTFAPNVVGHPDNTPNNHRWDCVVTAWPADPPNNGPERPWTEDLDEDGLLEPNEDLNDDGVLQTGNGATPGRGSQLAWLINDRIQSKIGTFITAYLHHVIRKKNFFSNKRFNNWADVAAALRWAHQDGISNGGALSSWQNGDPPFLDDSELTGQVLDQLQSYLTLHSWQDTLALPMGLFVTTDVGEGQFEIYGRLARGGDIDASFPDTGPDNIYGGASKHSVDKIMHSDGSTEVEVFDVGSEIYALREMLPRRIKMVKRSPVNINTAPLHLLVALFQELQGIYIAEEPISNKPDVVNNRDETGDWFEYFDHSRYEGNHWYRWMTPLYFDDLNQAGPGNRQDGQYVGLGRIHRSHPISFDVAAKLAYSIECLRRGHEDLNHNGRLDQDLDHNWNHTFEFAQGNHHHDRDINRSTPAHPQLGTHDSVDDFEDSFHNNASYPGNLNLVLDAPFSNWRSFDDFIDKILPDERFPEDLGGGQWHPHGDINRNGVLDDGGLMNENRHPTKFSLSLTDYLNEYGPLCSGDLSYVQKDVIKSNFNPNLHLNELNPDRLLSRWVDKLDLETYSTEFCFEPKGVFEIECLARILGPDRKVRARHRIVEDVEIFRVYKEDTQKEFLNHTQAGAWDDANHSVSGIFSPNTLRIDDSGDVDPTAVSVGHGDPAFPQGQALMSYPEVQRYDRIVDQADFLESGSYYEGYLGLAATSVKIGSGADGQSAIDPPYDQDLLLFRDPQAYSQGTAEGIKPVAVSTFFDQGVTLTDRQSSLIEMAAPRGDKVGPIDRGAGSPWGDRALIPNTPYLDLGDETQYPARHMADGVYSEAGGLLEFPWEDSQGDMLFDVRQGGAVMFWVKPFWRPEFSEKVRNFFSMAWINPNGGTPPNPSNAYEVAGNPPGSPTSKEDFYIADTSLLYQRFERDDPADPFRYDLDVCKWITRPIADLSYQQLDGDWGRASYDYTNEYSGKQKWGLAPFGCYFFPNHYGSFAGWAERYPHDLNSHGVITEPTNGADPGITRMMDEVTLQDETHAMTDNRLFHYGSNNSLFPKGAAGAGKRSNVQGPGRIQQYNLNWEHMPSREQGKLSPTEVRLYGYPTFRRAQEVRGLGHLDFRMKVSKCDYGLFSGDTHFLSANTNDPEPEKHDYYWQRDVAFGQVEKTGRSLGWGCGFTPESFNLTAVTRDCFAGGLFSANLYPQRDVPTVDETITTLESRRYVPEMKAERARSRFINMMEAGKWMHVALYSRLDLQAFADAGQNLVDLHPGGVSHQKSVLTFDGRDKGMRVDDRLVLYSTKKIHAPWMHDGLDFIPMGRVTDDDGLLTPIESAPGTNNTGNTFFTPTPGDNNHSFVSMDTYLEPASFYFMPGDHSSPVHTLLNSLPEYDVDNDEWEFNVIDTFPYRSGGYFAQSMALILMARARGTVEGPIYGEPKTPIRTSSNVDPFEVWEERYWPTINYSAEVDYLFQMYINGLIVNNGSHRWDQYDLNKFPLSLSSPLFNTRFSRGYGEGTMIDGVGPPAGPYPRTNFYDSPNNTLRFGEDAAHTFNGRLTPAIASCNYPADATFRNIVFVGTKAADPFPGGKLGVNRPGIWSGTGERGDWSFDYRPAFEHYFRGAFYSGHGSFTSQALNYKNLGISSIEATRLQWGRIKASLVTTTPEAWGDFHRFPDVRDSARIAGISDGRNTEQWGDFADDSFINNSPDQIRSRNTAVERRKKSHLPISLGYGRLDHKFSYDNGAPYGLYARIGGHPRPIDRSYVVADIVDRLDAFTPDGPERLSERVSADSGGPILKRDSAMNLEYKDKIDDPNLFFRYRLELNLDEKNPMAEGLWRSQNYRENNDRELPVLESPFIDDVTLSYSVGTKILNYYEEFD